MCFTILNFVCPFYTILKGFTLYIIKQRVVVDNIITEYIDITRGVPQGTVLGPILFSLMINDIKRVSPSNLFVKFADDITVSIPVRAEDGNIAESEVSSIMKWAEMNQMTLNSNKTWEMPLCL